MLTEPEIQTLVRRIQSGDARHEGAFQQLFELFFPPIVTFFDRRGFPHPTAEDLAQDVFFRVFKGIDEFRHEAKLKNWLFTIAGSVWKNALRDGQAQKRQAEEVPLDAAVTADDAISARRPPKLEDPGSGPLDKVLAAESTQVLAAALDELPARMRECVELRLQGYQNREVATLLGVQVTTVKTQLQTANQRLRPKLEPYFGADFGLDDEEV
jgi:RNA polymerase sigma-70 factor (ECF subfamily)